ncbi:MAG TPA: chemotaxis protein CheW [Kofleriaceae bacterium]|nr:chemotaxis protein CheW [Kofleriaceae bacterium]
MNRELKNVIVFTLGAPGGGRHAAELRWIREVVTLGWVTVIPGAPVGLAGAVNLRGNLVPVLEPSALMGGAGAPPPRQGDPALIVEDRGVVAALRVDQVHEVATCPAEGDGVLDARGRPLPLVDPRELVRRALAAAQALRDDGGAAVG